MANTTTFQTGETYAWKNPVGGLIHAFTVLDRSDITIQISDNNGDVKTILIDPDKQIEMAYPTVDGRPASIEATTTFDDLVWGPT